MWRIVMFTWLWHREYAKLWHYVYIWNACTWLYNCHRNFFEISIFLFNLIASFYTIKEKTIFHLYGPLIILPSRHNALYLKYCSPISSFKNHIQISPYLLFRNKPYKLKETKVLKMCWINISFLIIINI